MEEEDVPCYFSCPISLHMMRDPVTLPSGITYDRDGIERWLLAAGTCPLTKQPVPADCEPTPNHTLRRLIQAWCALHHHHLSSRKKPPPAADRASVAALISRIGDCYDSYSTRWSSSSSSSPQVHVHQHELLLAGLRELRDVAAESERNRKLIAAVPGAVDTLVSVFASAEEEEASCVVQEVALEIVSSLVHLSEQQSQLARVVETNDDAAVVVVDALVSVLRRSSSTSREQAAQVLADVSAVMPPNRLASLFTEQVFREVVKLLRDRPSKAATKAALHVLAGATPCGRNRVKAVDAGAVAAVVDMLLLLDQDDDERRVCELALAALDRLCGCAEGRAELVAHGAGVAVVGCKALLRVSEAATDKAVRVLRSVARHAATPAVVQEMAQSGVVDALCMVAQSGRYAERTRERARETLRMHAPAWRNSPCLHHHLHAVYTTTR